MPEPISKRGSCSEISVMRGEGSGPVSAQSMGTVPSTLEHDT